MSEEEFFSITRKNKIIHDDGTSEWKIITFNKVDNNPNFFSQDTWIFSSPRKYKVNNPKYIGNQFCDVIMSYFLSQTPYQCYNLVHDINAFHIQKNTSYSEYINSNVELLQEEWHKNAILLQETEFAYGLQFTTLEEYHNKINTNLFISFNEWAKTLTVPIVQE